jgi:2-dehydropantoate 2-reductase
VKLECLSIAQHEGINLKPDVIDQSITDVAINWPNQISSTAQDLAKHKATEIDFLNGKIVEKAKKYNINAPINEMLYSIVKMREYRQGNFNPSSPVEF